MAEATSLRAAPRFFVVRQFREIARLARRGEAMACVDVPIGLTEDGRRCDQTARQVLGWPRASSVFTPPSRAALRGRSSDACRALNLRSTGRSLSAQALGILPKIREVDELMTPRLQCWILETHPEVVFASLDPAGRGLVASKKSPAGRRQRLSLLPPSFAAAAPTASSRPFPAGDAALDDYLDALAALVAVMRLAAGTARRLPLEGEDRDGRGLAIEIVY